MISADRLDTDPKTEGVLMIVGGCLITLGSLLPWITVTSGFGSISRNGLDEGGDGITVLVVGIVGILLGLWRAGLISLGAGPPEGGWVIVNALLAGVIAFLNMNEVGNRSDDFETAFTHVGVGAGLWVVVIGAILLFVAGGLALRNNPPNERKRAPGPLQNLHAEVNRRDESEP